MAMTHDTLTNGVNPESGIHGGIHGKKFLYILTRVAKTRNLVLTAQFAFALEPFIEESWFGNDDFERLKGDVLMALGFIVGVDGLKRTVEDDCKLIKRAIALLDKQGHDESGETARVLTKVQTRLQSLLNFV